MITEYQLDLMNDVEVSPGFCPLCGDPWEACLCKSVDDFPEFGDFYNDCDCDACGEVFEDCHCEYGYPDWE